MTEGATFPQAQDVSVVILAKLNTSYTLRKMLDSLRGQSIRPIEILITDCNTPGDPYSLGLQEDVSQASDLKLISSGDHLTTAQICNAALQQCSGKYVAFIDGCDEWYPNKMARQLHSLFQLSATACCCNGYCRPAIREHLDSKLIYQHADECVSHWLASNMIQLCSQVLFDRQALLSAGGFDPELDTAYVKDALIRLSAAGKVAFIDDPLFVNTAPMGTPSADLVYKDLKHLFYKHYDMLLRDRRQYQKLSFKLSSQAKKCTLWLHMVAHSVTGFAKKPVHAAGSFLRGVIGAVRSGTVHAYRNLRLAFQTAGMHHALSQLRKGKTVFYPEVSSESVPAQEILLDASRHNIPLALANDQKLYHAIIPEHMTVIHRGMFANCTNLQRVVIPSTVTRIEDHAFQGCKKLQYVEFQPGSRLDYIGRYAFAGCQSLTGLVLSDSVARIEDYAFLGCASLTGLVFSVHTDEGVQHTQEFPVVINKLPRGIFAGCSALKQIQFPEGSLLTRIGNDAFLACKSLKYVYFAGDIVSIGSYSFAHCTLLDTFVMPKVDAVSGIGHHAFMHCTSLAHFRLPFKLTIIPRDAFLACTSLKYIKIPKNVTYIEPHAFAQCTDLESAIITSRNTKYAPNSFEAHTRIDMAC